ncbi:MAG: DNA-directed DNA polymerase [Micavibrio sp.]|nr:MAG: DNA-directed DNA polymerase [Micavibrio sp.]
MNHPAFIHLHTHSAYSLAEGAITVKDLVAICRQQKMPAVAVTDTNNLFGAMEFAAEAAKAGVQPIIGCQVSIGEEDHQIVLLVQNETGYRNLCKLISDAYLGGEDQEAASASMEELAAHADGLICLSGGSKGPVSQSLAHHQGEQAEGILLEFKKTFGDRFYIELQRHGWVEEEATEEKLIDLAYKHDVPLVATNDCYFDEISDHEAHDALLCIAGGRYITESDRRTVTDQHYFKSAKEMAALFEDIPEAIQNTGVIAQRCSFLLQFIKPILPPFKTEGGHSEEEELEAQAKEGLQWRLDNFAADEDHQPYWERLEYELGVINQMGFAGYFLIVSDFIIWAKDQDIPVGPGRGSGAGSVVSWALKITDLNPLQFGLLFERMLNPERVSMPDFDIDFCQERRDEVIRYVQERYGYDHVAQIITFGKLQARAVVRDVGRVLQMPYGQVDRIAKMIPNNPAAPMTLGEALAQDEELRNERNKDDTTKKLIDMALKLEGLYRHASTHAAGLVIGDRALHELVPLYRDPRSDMPVTQFNMKYVEQAGLVKFDFLGLKTMTVIHKTIELIERGGEKIDYLQIPLDDQKTYDLLASGNTVGVFQLESSGMRDVLRKMKPNRFEDIIALVALYRPGPMDNIPKYISTKAGNEEPDYLHPKLKPFLEETYGIMIYQEQVMQAAQELAGYTLGGADLLRRAMGKKIKAEMDAQRQMFMDGAKEHNNVPAGQANHIFDQIAKFAGYGFNKSHAAAYALIAYWTGWLKANHPVQFMAASMTLDLGNTDKLSIFKQDLDRMDIKLHSPDINESWPDFAVQDGAIRYALAALKGVGEAAMEQIVRERKNNGPFKSLEDFSMRVDPKAMNKRQFEHLACAGAFESLHKNRAQVHGGTETVLRYGQAQAEERDSGQVSLFGEGDDNALGMPDLPDIPEWDPLEKLSREFGAVGFYLSAHPLDTRAGQLERMDILSFSDVEEKLNHISAIRVQMAGVLLKKQEKIAQKSGNKYAFLQMSDPSGIYEVTLFSELLHQCRDVLEPGQALLLTVQVEQREDQMRFTAQKVQSLDQALEGKIREIHIHMENAAPVKKLREFIDIEGPGSSKIQIFVHTGEQDIEINLPGRWNLSQQARNIMRSEDGVTTISEI